MNLRLKLLIVGVLALLLGLTFSIPLLLSNVKPMTKVDLTVDVKYAYFSEQLSSGNTPGLGIGAQYPEYYLISYIIVLNVTNHSDLLASTKELAVVAAPQITVENSTVVARNPIVFDDRPISYVPGFDEYLVSNRSRLLTLTGTVSLPTIIYQTLLNATLHASLYVYGKVEAVAYGSGAYSTAFSIKQVQLQQYGSGFLYNALVSGNQLLQIDADGLDVYIQSGS